jgi:hypothetical protein
MPHTRRMRRTLGAPHPRRAAPLRRYASELWRSELHQLEPEVAFINHVRAHNISARALSQPIALKRRCTLECLFFTDADPTTTAAWAKACHSSAAHAGAYPITWAAIDLFKQRSDLTLAADGCMSGMAYRHRCCLHQLGAACSLMTASERIKLGWSSCAPSGSLRSTAPLRRGPSVVRLRSGGGAHHVACHLMLGRDYDCTRSAAGVCEWPARDAAWRCGQAAGCVGYTVDELTQQATLKLAQTWRRDVSPRRVVQCQRLARTFRGLSSGSVGATDVECGEGASEIARRWRALRCAALVDTSGHAARCDARVHAARVRALSAWQSFSKLHEGGECRSDDAPLGEQRTAADCAAACALAAGCRFFIYGYDTRARRCLHEKSVSRSCPEGWEPKDYSFYGARARTI